MMNACFMGLGYIGLTSAVFSGKKRISGSYSER